MNNPHFFVRSEPVVIGQNYEMADFDNPRGLVYGYEAYVVAEDDSGRRMMHPHTFINRDEAKAEREAEVIRSGIINRGVINEALWREIEPRYG